MPRPERMAMAAILLLLATSAASFAASRSAASEVQGSLFKRIFSYDKALKTSSKIVVILVSEDKNGLGVSEMVDAFRQSGLFPAVVSPADLGADLTATLGPSSSVVYATASVDPVRVAAFCAQTGILSISGDPVLTEEGHISISIDGEKERPEIVVNMDRLRTEKHELSADLLKLARVIP